MDLIMGKNNPKEQILILKINLYHIQEFNSSLLSIDEMIGSPSGKQIL
jgi:hypothetical protein